MRIFRQHAVPSFAVSCFRLLWAQSFSGHRLPCLMYDARLNVRWAYDYLILEYELWSNYEIGQQRGIYAICKCHLYILNSLVQKLANGNSFLHRVLSNANALTAPEQNKLLLCAIPWMCQKHCSSSRILHCSIENIPFAEMKRYNSNIHFGMDAAISHYHFTFEWVILAELMNR